MPRHFTDAEKEQIRQDLITMGKDLFERFGLNKTTIEEICKSASIGKGTFYLFFNSKGDLFMEIYRIERNKVREELYRKYYNKQGDVGQLFKEYVFELLDLLKQKPMLNIAFDNYALGLIIDKAVRNRVMEYNLGIQKDLTELVGHWYQQRGINEGTLRPEIVAAMIRSLANLKFHEQAVGIKIFDDTMKAFIDCIAIGLRMKI